MSLRPLHLSDASHIGHRTKGILVLIIKFNYLRGFLVALMCCFSSNILSQTIKFDCPDGLVEKEYFLKNENLVVYLCEDESGLKQGTSKVYNLNGDYLETEYENVDGKFHGVAKRYSSSGRINTKSVYENGRLVSEHHSLPFVIELVDEENSRLDQIDPHRGWSMRVTKDRVLLLNVVKTADSEFRPDDPSIKNLAEIGCIFLGDNLLEIDGIEIQTVTEGGVVDAVSKHDLSKCRTM